MVLALGILLAGMPAVSTAQEPITRIAEARSLARTEAARALPVKLRGVVTWRGEGPLRGAMVVQDESAGIYVNGDLARARGFWQGDEAEWAAVQVGALVEIEGVTDRGGNSPPIVPRTVRIVGEQALPAARSMEPARFFSGAEDCQRIEVRGVVQGIRTQLPYLTLMLDANPGRFMALIPAAALPNPEALVDAEVRLTGAPHSRFNTRGEFLMPNIALNGPADLVVEKPAPSGPFEAPKVALNAIAEFRPEPLNAHRLRVEGTVTYAGPGDLLFIEDGGTGIRVKVLHSVPVKAGDRVEVAGFVDESQHFRGLAYAEVRKTGRGPVEEPINVQPEEIVTVNTRSARSSLIAHPGDFNGRLIRFEATLVDILETVPGQQRLVLATRNSSVIATLPMSDSGNPDFFPAGSKLSVTGVAQLVFDPDAFIGGAVAPLRVDVLLRGPADIVILEVPSWWTRTRVLYALAGVAGAFGAAVLWVTLLRRRVGVQATQLAAEMRARRESAVEFQATLRERNRLAANLHDTLLQTVGGIGYQLDACEASAGRDGVAVGPQLEVARRMVDHAAAELRGSVWALRALPLHGRSLPEALRELAGHVGMGHATHIEVRTASPLPEVPEFISGNLLLIVQEALHNALKHAHPTHIVVAAAVEGKEISVTIQDDGQGFAMGSERGPAQGHFGLAGMKERVDRLAGRLEIDSTPGQGTTIRARVFLREFDEDVPAPLP